MDVLFLSGIDGFCHRYAVLHRAAQLRLRGIAATIRHFADPRALDDVARARAVFLYRVPLSPLAAEVVRRARRAGRLVLGAVDDLIFVPEESALPPLDHLPRAERLLWLDGVARYRAMLERCDAFVAASEPLLEEARAIGWPAFLHRDAASAVELALGERARERRGRERARQTPPARVRLGYFSGTPTHDADFAEIADVLAEVLRARPSVDLSILGPLVLPNVLRPFADRIERRPLVPWPELPDAIAAVDVNLAPLAWQSRFGVAKGEGKYLEAAAVGVPTVASPTPAFRNAIRDRIHGRLAADPEAWRRALIELIDEPDLRAALGCAAFADVRARFSPDVRADELVQIFAEASPGRALRAAAPTPSAAIAWRAGERSGRVALEPDASPDLASSPGERISPPLGAGAILEQEFTPANDGLCRIDLSTVTHGQTLAHHLAILVERDDGRVVTVRHEEARHAPDRAWFAVELPTEVASGGKRYRIVLRAAGTGSGNALRFALAHSPAGDDRPRARLDGVPIGGALALRTFARWDSELTAGTSTGLRRRGRAAAAAGPGV